MGEGSGILIFEELDHARGEGGAHLCGSGWIWNDGRCPSSDRARSGGKGAGEGDPGCPPDGRGPPEEIDYINPHGTSTPLNDKVETKVIKDVFGKQAYQIPISSTKSITGHMMGAAGGVEAIAVLLTLERGIIHPTKNYEFPDPECDLDYVPNQARKKEVRTSSLHLCRLWRGEQRPPL